MIEKCVCHSIPLVMPDPNSSCDWIIHCSNPHCDAVPTVIAPDREEAIEDWNLNIRLIKKSKVLSCKQCSYYSKIEKHFKDDEEGGMYCEHPDNVDQTKSISDCGSFDQGFSEKDW